MLHLPHLVIGEQEPPTIPVFVNADLRPGHERPFHILRNPGGKDRGPTDFKIHDDNEIRLGTPNMLLDHRKTPRRIAHFPDMLDIWAWSVRQDQDIVAEAYPGDLGRHIEVHVPMGTNIEVEGTNTPVVVWGNPGSLMARRCTSFTAIVDLEPDIQAKDDPYVMIDDVGTAFVMLWNANGEFEINKVDDLSLGVDKYTAADGGGPEIVVRDPEFLRTMTEGRRVSVRGRTKLADVRGSGGAIRIESCVALRSHGDSNFLTRLQRGPRTIVVEHLLASGEQALEIDETYVRTALIETAKFNTFTGARVAERAYVNSDAVQSGSTLAGSTQAKVYIAGPRTGGWVPVDYPDFGDTYLVSANGEDGKPVRDSLHAEWIEFSKNARLTSAIGEAARNEAALQHVKEAQGPEAEARLRGEHSGERMLEILEKLYPQPPLPEIPEDPCLDV